MSFSKQVVDQVWEKAHAVNGVDKTVKEKTNVARGL